MKLQPFALMDGNQRNMINAIKFIYATLPTIRLLYAL